MSTIRLFPAVSTFALFSGIAACAVAPSESISGDEEKEVWDSANNPAFVDNTFIYEADKLPVKGETHNKPIAGDYWATYRDSVNVRWDGDNSQSPAEKFGAAFGKPNTAMAVSQGYGIRSRTDRKECTTDGDCTSTDDGSSCAIPRGETKGRCIPTWWGICHGWSPYAISEAPPTAPVTKNGVTFFPGDIIGLMSLVYSESLPTKFLSQRCNTKEPKMDPDGRVTAGECRDMNPGSMHVVVTNMLGLRGVGAVEDRTWNDQVWNQPMRGYDITNAVGGKLKEITKAEAIGLLGANVTFTTTMPAADLAKGAKQTGSYTATAAGELTFKLNGSGDADLFIKKNGDATEAANDCSSTGSSSSEECKITVAAGDKIGWLVLGYADKSNAALSVGTVSPNATYSYNPAAARFYYVEMDLHYISEARPAHTLPNSDDYTSTDHYQYILEADANGRIQGGEWVGSSRTAHPDFMWWPNGTPSGSPAGISYADLKSLVSDGSSSGSGGTTDETKSVFADQTVTTASYYGTFGVPAGVKTVTFTMSGTGNADLYVKLGSKPSIYSSTCKSTGATSSETCTVTVPASGGTYYVRARPMAASSTVSVTATLKK